MLHRKSPSDFGRAYFYCDTIVGYTDESGVTLPPLHPRCRCAIIYDEVAAPRKPKPTSKPESANQFNFDTQRFGEKVKLNINGVGEANIPLDKLTKYALNPDKAPDKALAFEKALGYDLNNVDRFIENIKSNVNNYKMEEKPDLGYGKRFQQIIEITGENGKTANVLLAWILDKNTGEFRLTSIYVDKK